MSCKPHKWIFGLSPNQTFSRMDPLQGRKKDQQLLKVIKNEEEWTDRQFNQILDKTLAEISQLRGKQLPSILLIELN